MEFEVAKVGKPDPRLLLYYFIVSCLSVFAFPFVFIPLYFRFHTLHYDFDDEGVSMGYGILFRKETHLTFARMQDIHLSQNILERWLGIGTVTIQTAGAGAGGDLKIWGVREFEPIRDYLYERLRGVRQPAGAHGPQAGAGGLSSELLGQIRDELHAAAQALSAGRR